MSKKRRLHPLEIAAKNASFDIIEYIRKKIRDYDQTGSNKQMEGHRFDGVLG